MDTKELLDRLRCPGIDACPLQDTRTTCTECQKTVKKEAAEVIEKLEAENAQLIRERDAAVADLVVLVRFASIVIAYVSLSQRFAKDAPMQATGNGVEYRRADDGI